jgi:ribosome-binding factor A
MKTYPRSERIADMIHREIAVYLQREISDPRLTEVSITAVDVGQDLRNATVFFTVLDKTTVESVEKTLNKAVGHFKRLLASSLNMRHIPAIHFRYDATIVQAAELSALIDSVA